MSTGCEGIPLGASIGCTILSTGCEGISLGTSITESCGAGFSWTVLFISVAKGPIKSIGCSFVRFSFVILSTLLFIAFVLSILFPTAFPSEPCDGKIFVKSLFSLFILLTPYYNLYYKLIKNMIFSQCYIE